MLDLQLKEFTRTDHALLEKKFLTLINRIDTPEDYVSFLGLLYGYYAEVEKQLNKYLLNSDITDYSSRRKASMLIDDIGVFQNSERMHRRCEEVPAINSYHSALGVLYVIEGSTLGGQIISKILSTRLKSDSGFSFFHCYGNHVNEMWSRFKSYLHKPFTPTQQAEILNAALSTFATLNYWISSHEY
jgi:heme oxygenase (biliverdin-IX-beta and delta-forming)